jgi:hypothetical protein
LKLALRHPPHDHKYKNEKRSITVFVGQYTAGYYEHEDDWLQLKLAVVHLCIAKYRELQRAVLLWMFILLIGRSGGGVQLGSLGTAATSGRSVQTPGEYDGGEFGGMMIGIGNRSTRRNPAPVTFYPPQTPHALPGREPGPLRWEASD